MILENCILGIELGSTRIKAVLIDEHHSPIATGAYNWQNSLENGVWVYHLEDAITGLRSCYAALNQEVTKKYGQPLKKIAAIGISGMMHGYLVLDKNGRQLAPFRTWRNTITGEAADTQHQRHTQGDEKDFHEIVTFHDKTLL